MPLTPIWSLPASSKPGTGDRAPSKESASAVSHESQRPVRGSPVPPALAKVDIKDSMCKGASMQPRVSSSPTSSSSTTSSSSIGPHRPPSPLLPRVVFFVYRTPPPPPLPQWHRPPTAHGRGDASRHWSSCRPSISSITIDEKPPNPQDSNLDYRRRCHHRC
jgi:hypothetical protein